MSIPKDPGQHLRLPQVFSCVLLVTAAHAALHYKWILNLIVSQYRAHQIPVAGLNAAALLVSGMLFACLVLTLSRRALSALFLLLLPSLWTGFIYSRILGATLDFEAFRWLTQEAARASDVAAQYLRTLIAASGAVLAMVGLIVFARRASGLAGRVSRGVQALLGVLWIGTAFSLSGLSALPRFLPTYDTAPLVFAQWMSTLVVPSRPDSVPLDPGPPRAEKIVIVVDESVNYAASSTIREGWRQKFGDTMLDLGEAWSGTNCSAGSNAMIRWVAAAAQVTEGLDPRGGATLWQYATRAGFRTTFIDGQTAPGGRPGNFFNREELQQLDEFMPLDDGLKTDLRIGEAVANRLRLPGRQLVYVNLRGAHFPYHAFPDAEVSGLDEPARYQRSVDYSKQGFMQAMFGLERLENLLVIYTSDHGQHFGGPFAAHCNAQGWSLEEYSVPLVAFSGSSAIQQHLRRQAGKARASHFQIAPTALWAMGYPQEGILALVGPDLGGVMAAVPLLRQTVFPSRDGAPPPVQWIPR